MRDILGIQATLRKSPLFSTLPDSTLEAWAPLFREKLYGEGDPIYKIGAPAEHLFVIASGRVRVVRQSADGKEMIVGLYGRGDFVGCCCALEGISLPCSATAAAPTLLLLLARNDFFRMMREQPDFAIHALQETTRRLRASHARAKSLAVEPVERRIICALLELDQRFGAPGEDGSRIIRCRISRQELADMSGTTLESASRTMARLTRRGWIRSARQYIQILEPAVLNQQEYLPD